MRADRREDERRGVHGRPLRPPLIAGGEPRRGDLLLAERDAERGPDARDRDRRRTRIGVAVRGAKTHPAVRLRGPDSDHVVAEHAGDHVRSGREILLRIVPHGREPRELVQHERLLAILFRPAHRLRGDERRGDVARDLLEGVEGGLGEPILGGRGVLHVDDADRAIRRPHRGDDRFADRGVVAGEALVADLAGQQERFARPRDVS